MQNTYTHFDFMLNYLMASKLSQDFEKFKLCLILSKLNFKEM